MATFQGHVIPEGLKELKPLAIEGVRSYCGLASELFDDLLAMPVARKWLTLPPNDRPPLIF